MIRNKNYMKLFMDYSTYFGYTHIHPIDIDMFYIANNDAHTIVMGEIKNEQYKQYSWESQKKYITQFLKRIKGEVLFVFIIHNKYYQNGDRIVNIPNCYIKEYYWCGKWQKPEKPTKVKDIFDKYKPS